MGSIVRVWLAAECGRGLQHGRTVWRIAELDEGQLGCEIPLIAGCDDDDLACGAGIYCNQIRWLHDLILVLGVIQALRRLQRIAPSICRLCEDRQLVAINPSARCRADGLSELIDGHLLSDGLTRSNEQGGLVHPLLDRVHHEEVKGAADQAEDEQEEGSYNNRKLDRSRAVIVALKATKAADPQKRPAEGSFQI